jgi:predicted 2-oxoglutarate/Fe(II)-dependent dioxygenase YbiX
MRTISNAAPAKAPEKSVRSAEKHSRTATVRRLRRLPVADSTAREIAERLWKSLEKRKLAMAVSLTNGNNILD